MKLMRSEDPTVPDPRARGLDSGNGKKTGEEAVNELMRTHYIDRRAAQDWIKEIVG